MFFEEVAVSTTPRRRAQPGKSDGGVVGTDPSHTETWAAAPAHISDARRFISAHLVAHGHASVVPDAQLVVSELATNAVRHAGTAFTVTVSIRDETVLVEVADTATTMPVPCAAAACDDSGRGLSIVAALSRDWGVTREPDGSKSVWASIPTAGTD